MHNSNSEEIDDFNDDLGDETESPEVFSNSMSGSLHGNLIHSRSGQLLICAPQAIHTAHRKFDMFLEFVGRDDTDGTNSEQRALYKFCGKDNENRVFPWMWGLLCKQLLSLSPQSSVPVCTSSVGDFFIPNFRVLLEAAKLTGLSPLKLRDFVTLV